MNFRVTYFLLFFFYFNDGRTEKQVIEASGRQSLVKKSCLDDPKQLKCRRLKPKKAPTAPSNSAPNDGRPQLGAIEASDDVEGPIKSPEKTTKTPSKARILAPNPLKTEENGDNGRPKLDPIEAVDGIETKSTKNPKTPMPSKAPITVLQGITTPKIGPKKPQLAPITADQGITVPKQPIDQGKPQLAPIQAVHPIEATQPTKIPKKTPMPSKAPINVYQGTNEESGRPKKDPIEAVDSAEIPTTTVKITLKTPMPSKSPITAFVEVKTTKRPTKRPTKPPKIDPETTEEPTKSPITAFVEVKTTKTPTKKPTKRPTEPPTTGEPTEAPITALVEVKTTKTPTEKPTKPPTEPPATDEPTKPPITALVGVKATSNPRKKPTTPTTKPPEIEETTEELTGAPIIGWTYINQTFEIHTIEIESGQQSVDSGPPEPEMTTKSKPAPRIVLSSKKQLSLTKGPPIVILDPQTPAPILAPIVNVEPEKPLNVTIVFETTAAALPQAICEDEYTPWRPISNCTNECGGCGTWRIRRECVPGCTCRGRLERDENCNYWLCWFPKPSCCAPRKRTFFPDFKQRCA